MQWINDKTPGIRQRMTDLGLPSFGFGVNSAHGTFHYIGNSGNMYHNQVPQQIAKGQQRIGNQLSGLQDYTTWQQFDIGNIPDQQFVSQSPLADGVADVWNWTKEHFYAGAEGEISYGVQLSGTLKNGIGFNAAPYHEVRYEGSLNNKGRPVSLDSPTKLKVHDYGLAYYVGANYNQTIDYSRSYRGIKTNTISVGAFGVVGVTLNFDANWSFISGFGGIDISGKVAILWGASGSLKIGFEY